MKTKFNGIFTLLLALAVQVSFAQERTISGTVSDETGPLPGVSVLKKGTVQGTETDFDGKYTIKAKTGDILVFSFVGMETVEKAVGTSNKMNVSMKAGNVLDEVVVTALGIEKEKDEDLSSSTVVKTEAISKSGEAGIVQSLAGKTSGLKVTRNSGDPGAGANIQIRGANTISGSSSPLIVVDGVPISNSSIGGGPDGVAQQSRLNDINSEDIESVTILKGASAAAVWGTGAANGVIVIQTKKGKLGKVSVNVKSSVSIDEINIEFEKQNKFGQGRPKWWYGIDNDYSVTAGRWMPNVGESWGDKISDRQGGANDVIYGNERFVAESGNIYYPIDKKNDKTVYNDVNRNQVFRTGITLNNSIGINFSSEKSRTYLSYSNLNQTGIIKGKSSYLRNTLRLNHSVKLSDNIDMRFNTSYANISSERIQQGSNIQGLYLGYLRTAPDFNNTDYKGTYYDANGIPTFRSHRGYRNYLGSSSPTYSNPGWVINEQENPNKVERFTIAPQFVWKFATDLSLTARYGLDYYNDKRETYFPVYTSVNNPTGSYSRRDIVEKTQNVNLFLQANKVISDNFNLDLILGATYDSNDYSSLTAGSTNFSNPDVRDVRILTNSVLTDRSISTYIEETGKIGAYTVINLDIYDQLLVELSGRMDKSSTAYDPTFYPSVSIGWKFSELLDNDSFLNLGKIRLAYGEVGIEPTAYRNATTYSPGGVVSTWGDELKAAAYGNPFSRNYTKGNPDLTIERVKEFEVGTDFRFWNNRVTFGATYYNRKTEDAILNLSLPPSTGYEDYWANAATISNTGVELDLGVKIINESELKWNVDVNWSTNKNMVDDLSGVKSVFLGGFTGTSSRVVEGHAMGVLWGTAFERDNDGNYVLDVNGFPTVSSAQSVLGDPNPDWIGGLGTTFSYKGILLSAQFETSQGNDIWSGTEGVLKYFGIHPETANETVAKTDLKTADGRVITAGTTFRGNVGNFGDKDVALDSEWYTSNGGGFGSQSETFVEDASWTRLREITLGYSFPEEIINKLGLTNLEFSLSGRNLALWTDIEGFDPDLNLTGAGKAKGLDYFTNPSTQSYIATIKFGF